MATHTGIEGQVKLGANAIAEVIGFSTEVSADTVEDTALTDTAKTFIGLRYSWTASVECHWDETDTNGQLALETAILAGSTVTLNLYPEGSTTGDKYLTGTALCTSMSIPVTMGDTIKRTCSFQGTGALSFSTAP